MFNVFSKKLRNVKSRDKKSRDKKSRDLKSRVKKSRDLKSRDKKSPYTLRHLHYMYRHMTSYYAILRDVS